MSDSHYILDTSTRKDNCNWSFNKVATMKPIIDVYDIATEAEVQKQTRKLSNGHKITFAYSDRLAFSLDEFQRRYDLIQIKMEIEGLDALLVRGPENITYLCGYETPGYYKYHCVVVTPDKDPIFVIRSYEIINVPEYSWLTKAVLVEEDDHPPSLTASVLQELKLDGKRIGVEKQGFYYTVEEHETLCKELPDAEFVDAIHILWDSRVIKSPDEISLIRKSSAIVDKAMRAGWNASAYGISANEINATVNKTIFENGGEYMGLPPFVLAGERSCLPHQTGGSNVLKQDDVMFFEISASQHRYCCARMYTIFIGNPRQEMLDCAQVLIDAVGEAMTFIKSGRTAHECDEYARSFIHKHGFGDNYRNRLGYSIGINYPPDWGEGEILSLRQGEERELQPSMTFHMPPTNMKYREYGIGYSESIMVTENGCEKFSNLPLELIIK